jgi:hypothetical protein
MVISHFFSLPSALYSVIRFVHNSYQTHGVRRSYIMWPNAVLRFMLITSPLPHAVSEPLTNRGVLLSTLLQDILNTSHHLLNVLLQIANKLGLPGKKKKVITAIRTGSEWLSTPPSSLVPSLSLPHVLIFVFFPSSLSFMFNFTALICRMEHSGTETVIRKGRWIHKWNDWKSPMHSLS